MFFNTAALARALGVGSLNFTENRKANFGNSAQIFVQHYCYFINAKEKEGDSVSVILVIDIETRISSRGSAYLTTKEFEPDARLKDPEKIKASIEHQRQKEIDQAALYWWFSYIICISAINFKTKIAKIFSGDDEKLLLANFFAHIESQGDNVTLIGKSSAQFDIPFIIGRALALNLGLPECFRQKIESLNDIDQIFSRFRMCSQITSLENYAFGLGIDGKLGKGCDVAKMHQDGRWDDIEAYCQRDAEIVCEMLSRYQKPFNLIEF